MADFKFCTACGRKVALNARFCGGCGAALGAKEQSVQSCTARPEIVKARKPPAADTREPDLHDLWKIRGSHPPDLNGLTRALRHKDDKSAEAAELLGYIGDQRTAGALISALNDPNEEVRQKAVTALGYTLHHAEISRVIADSRIVPALIAH